MVEKCNEYLILTLNCVGNSYYKTTASLINQLQCNYCGIMVLCQGGTFHISCMVLTTALEGQVF